MKLNIQPGNRIYLSSKLADNIFYWEDQGEFRLEDLSVEISGNKGGNSAVFRLVNTEDEDQVFVIKFLKFPLSNRNYGMNERFEREIKALEEAKRNRFEHVIQILHEGTYFHKEDRTKYRFYIMEKADGDLADFILKKENQLIFSQKIQLCYDIIRGINELHSIGVYHRDIKPDNIFLVHSSGKPTWKIGDLGLMASRNEDISYERGKKIGPANWLSPEAMNNALCGNTIWKDNFDISIDDRSDVFQLGNVLWFVFNHNAPIGQVTINDFHTKDHFVFSLLFTMLRHTKKNRKPLSEYEKYFLQLDQFYLSRKTLNSRWFTRKCRKILRT